LKLNLAAHTVPLAKAERLVFDVHQNLYRIAYYRPRYDKTGTQVGEERWTAKHKSLVDGLTIVFGEANAPHDPLATEQYMRSCGWGKDLP
jgi:hypothetical protein